MSISKNLLSLLLMFLATQLLASCAGVNPGGGRFSAEPPQTAPSRAELPRELSSVNIAVDLSAAELGQALNRLVPKELYRGSPPGTGVTAKVVRKGPITVGIADNYLHITVPISVTCSYGIFETLPFSTALRFQLHPKVGRDWSVDAQMTYTGLSDSLADSIKLGPISLKPRSLVEGVLQPVQRLLADQVNRKLNEEFSLKKQVTKAWNAAQNPILIDSARHAWLVVTPTAVLLYPLTFERDRVKVSLGMHSFAEVVVGPKPVPQAPAPLPQLKIVGTPDRTFRVALNSELYYGDLRAIALPLLLKKDFGRAGNQVFLKDLELYGNGDRLIIKVVTEGSIDGTFYLTCRPALDPQTGLFSVRDVDFDIQSKNLLVATADWFLHGTIRDSIQEKLNLDLSQRLNQARELAAKQLSRVRVTDGIALTGKLKTMKLNDVMVQREKISIRVYAEGESAILFQ